MKNLRRLTPFAAIIMSLNLLFVSCAPTADDDSATISAKYSGEEIFQGLFFFQHDIAANIPQLNQLAVERNAVRADDIEVDQYLNDMETMAMDYINTHYPDFFDELQKVMYSGDYYQIQQKLDLGGQFLEQAVLTSEKFFTAYVIGKEISKDVELTAKIQALDLTLEADQKQLDKLLSMIDSAADIDAKAIGVAVVRNVTIAVNIAVAVTAIHVTTTTILQQSAFVIYYSPNFQSDESALLNDELFVAEVSSFFGGYK